MELLTGGVVADKNDLDSDEGEDQLEGTKRPKKPRASRGKKEEQAKAPKKGKKTKALVEGGLVDQGEGKGTFQPEHSPANSFLPPSEVGGGGDPGLNSGGTAFSTSLGQTSTNDGSLFGGTDDDNTLGMSTVDSPDKDFGKSLVLPQLPFSN